MALGGGNFPFRIVKKIARRRQGEKKPLYSAPECDAFGEKFLIFQEDSSVLKMREKSFPNSSGTKSNAHIVVEREGRQ